MYTLNNDVLPFIGLCKYNLLSSRATRSDVFPEFQLNIKMAPDANNQHMEYLEFILNDQAIRLRAERSVQV